MASQQISGLASGMTNTDEIIAALMSIEKASYNRTSEKVQSEQLRLEAYRSVNTMLTSLQTAVNNLSSTALWNAKAANSSNESSLSATATQYAAEGSYSLRVAQLASTAQYASKGYSSQNSTVLPSGASSGKITLESSQAKVDRSAKLETLNGGKGVFRGGVRITDASGASGVVDLSGCETLDQVVSALNSAAGVNVNAKISDDGLGLEITDSSGGTNALKIQNVGAGTTATDLGIAGTATAVNGKVVLKGEPIHYLSAQTELASLNDGLGVENGTLAFAIKGANANIQLNVDLTSATTLGDVIEAFNSTINAFAEAHPEHAAEIAGLSLGFNAEGNALQLNGTKAGSIYAIADANGSTMMAQPQMASQLGLEGTWKSTGGDIAGGRILGGLDSPMLKNLSGANKTGIGSSDSWSYAPVDTLDGTTLVKNLNGGQGLGASFAGALQIKVYEGGNESSLYFGDLLDSNVLAAMMADDTTTLGDVLDYVNDAFANSDYRALKDVRIEIDSAGKGVYLTGLSSTCDYEFGGSLMESLGLVFNGPGSAADGYGAMIEGAAISQNVEDLFASAAMKEATPLFSNDHKDGNGDARITNFLTTDGNGNTALAGLEQFLEAYDFVSEVDLPDQDPPVAIGDTVTGYRFNQAAFEAAMNGGMTVTVDGQAIAIDLSGLIADPDAKPTLNDFVNLVNTTLENELGAAGMPFLALGSNGLAWHNVDTTKDFAVDGDFAAALGMEKSYTAEAAATQGTTIQKDLNPVAVGTVEKHDLAGTDALASLNGGAGLGFGGDELTFTFTLADNSTMTVAVSNADLAAALGGGATLDDYITALNTVVNQAIADQIGADGLSGSLDLTFGIAADGTGLTITNIHPTDFSFGKIEIGGAMATPGSTGLAAATVTPTDIPVFGDIRSSTTTHVDPADTTGLGYINLTIGGDNVRLDTAGLSGDNTLRELLTELNKQLADAGHADVQFVTSDSGTGIALSNGSNGSITIHNDAVSSLASDLGLVSGGSEVVAAQGHMNGQSLNRHYIDRATALSTLNNGKGADMGVMKITDAAGTSVTLDLSECLTVGDAIDAINGTMYGLRARINDTGDGILVEQTPGVGQGAISISSFDGSKTAEHLGIAGTGVKGEDGISRIDGSFKTVIEVGPDDTLVDLRNRIAAAGEYTTSIINDGSGTNSHRLSITAAGSGAGYDFIVDTNLDFLGASQVTKGQDALVLMGDPDSAMSPIALRSSTNTNNQAISGVTLNLGAKSDTYTTLTVSTDTSKVVDAISELAQAYNDLSDMIAYLDAYTYDEESGKATKGILFGDNTVRGLMDSIDEIFAQTFNPNNLTFSQMVASTTKQVYTWSDIGVTFSNNDTAEGDSTAWYQRMNVDLDALEDMVMNNWDMLENMLAGTRNASDSTLPNNVAASAHFNYHRDLDENGNPIKPEGESDPNNAINGNKSSADMGTGNGFTANKTIAEGENTYTITFQKPTTLDRISIYHPDSASMPAEDFALSAFTVEYLNSSTGKWEELRDVPDNDSYVTIIGLANQPITASAIRITATETNAADGKFRLLDVQCQESTGLAGKLNKTMNSLCDVVDGFFVGVTEEVENKIADLNVTMDRQSRMLEMKEQALWRKFTAMETALSTLQNQGDYFDQLMTSMTNNAKSK